MCSFFTFFYYLFLHMVLLLLMISLRTNHHTLLGTIKISGTVDYDLHFSGIVHSYSSCKGLDHIDSVVPKKMELLQKRYVLEVQLAMKLANTK